MAAALDEAEEDRRFRAALNAGSISLLALETDAHFASRQERHDRVLSALQRTAAAFVSELTGANPPHQPAGT